MVVPTDRGIPTRTPKYYNPNEKYPQNKIPSNFTFGSHLPGSHPLVAAERTVADGHLQEHQGQNTPCPGRHIGTQ